ncbi:MAG: DinB family protein [Acidobacteria bacterium]|nr:DinB family protein [Acidobacteriota bacterium]
MSQNNGEIDGFVKELGAVASDASKVFGSLSAAQLNWKPSAGQWSVGQCFDHLIVTNRCFFPDMERVANGTYRSSLWGRVSPLSGFFARFIMKALDPEQGRKTKAPRVFEPAQSNVAADVIRQFVAHQDELSAHMRATERADLRGLKVTSPVSPVATYSLLDAYRIVVAHERSHFEQARRVTQSEGFPSA